MAERELNQSAEKTPRLEMKNISKRFGATIALDGVTFSVLPGEVHALVGENGAGKSTLMKILSGAHQPDEGSMRLEGEAYQPRHPLDARLTGVGMIYQELSLALHLTVEENILLGMEPAKWGWVNRQEVRQRASDAIQRFNHPEIQPQTPVRELSVSARQLVEIGRSLAVGCQVLVLDEPTSSLSREDIRRLFEIVRDLKAQGLSIIYISHFLEEVQEIADRVTVLRDGKTIDTRNVSEVSPDEIVRMMVGREMKDLYPRSPRQQGDVLLTVNQLSGPEKPESASFALHRGEVLGIFGLVGAGRTELLRTIFGLDELKSGEIKIGAFVGPGVPVEHWQAGMGMLSEDRKEEGLALNLSIADNVTLSRLRDFGPARLVMPQQQNNATNQWIERLNIRCREPQQLINELSGGNQQKAALARLLQHDVDILLLDEPTRGIDVAAKALIYQVIDDIASKQPAKAVLMISSYLPELLGVCDRIAVMHRGQLGEALPTARWDEHKLMLEATGQ